MRTIHLATVLATVIAAAPCFAQAPAEKDAAGSNQQWRAAGVIDGYKTHIYSLAFGPGSTLVAGDAEGVRVWDVLTKQQYPFYQRPTKYASAITRINYAPDDSWVSFQGLHEHHIAFGKKYITEGRPIDFGVGGKGDSIWPLAIASDGIISACRFEADKNVVKLIRQDYFGPPPVRSVVQASCRGHEQEPLCASFSPDGKLLATGSLDKTARLWDAATGKQLAILAVHADAVSVILFSPDGELIATGSKDGRIRLWDAKTRTERSSLPGTTAVRCLAFSPDSASIASGDEKGEVRIWTVQDAKSVVTVADHAATVFAVAFSRNGNLLASGGQDRVIRLWAQPK